MPDFITLWCVVDDDYAPFQIFIHRDYKIDALKVAIKLQKANALRDFDAPSLAVWKLKDSISIAVKPADTLVQRIGLSDLSEFADKLDPSDTLFSIFPTQPPSDCIHIIVKVPRTIMLSASSSNESNASSIPSVSDDWSPRHATVYRLYDILRQERLVHVRGTPGSGKTSLMNLLAAFILEREPSAFVKTQHSWVPAKSDELLKKRLRSIDPAFPRSRRNGIAYLLFDEAQDSYEDEFLWNHFFKGVGDRGYRHYRVILFCSYGSPSSRPVLYHIGTPLELTNAARISLWPRKGLEGSIGLLLNRSEFDEVVSRFEPRLNLHSELLDLIFEWTVGHVGAVIRILDVISDKGGVQVRRGEQVTVKMFHDKNPTHDLVSVLRGRAFGRGLPVAAELSALTDVVTLFRKLLKNDEIVKIDKNQDEDEEDKAIRKCHRHGWIQADQTANAKFTRYTFPSPLHAVCVSWMLEPTIDMRKFASPLDLAINVISMFKPSQLKNPIRRAGPRLTDKLPEAQYQSEFYRSVFSVTSGNVCISPEFASASSAPVAGRIDFFIPVVKWGIEITRDGRRLTEHSSCFAPSGAYGAWLTSGDMTDYILLDCRTSIPKKPHPEILNLFHVVFQDDYREVVVYDNMVKPVKEPITLLENH